MGQRVELHRLGFPAHEEMATFVAAGNRPTESSVRQLAVEVALAVEHRVHATVVRDLRRAVVARGVVARELEAQGARRGVLPQPEGSRQSLEYLRRGRDRPALGSVPHHGCRLVAHHVRCLSRAGDPNHQRTNEHNYHQSKLRKAVPSRIGMHKRGQRH